MRASPLRPPYHSTSKIAHTHTERNVGHSERIYSRIQNTGKNLFPFNLLPRSFVQCGRMNSSKVTVRQEASWITHKNRPLTWHLIKWTWRLKMEIYTHRERNSIQLQKDENININSVFDSQVCIFYSGVMRILLKMLHLKKNLPQTLKLQSSIFDGYNFYMSCETLFLDYG